MNVGSRVEIIDPDSPFFAQMGVLDSVTDAGLLIVRIEGPDGPDQSYEFDPFDVEVVLPTESIWEWIKDFYDKE